MKITMLKLAGTLAVLTFWLVGSGPANVRGDEPARARKAAPPKSLILELETDNSGSYGWGSARTMTEVLAKPGDGIGKPNPGFAMADTAAFTVVEIIDKDHVKVRVSHRPRFQGRRESRCRQNGGDLTRR